MPTNTAAWLEAEQAPADGRYLAAPGPRVVGKGLGHVRAGSDARKRGVSAQKVVSL